MLTRTQAQSIEIGRQPEAPLRDRAIVWPILAVAGLAAVEMIVISFLFSFPLALPEIANPVAYVKGAARSAILAVVVFTVVAWPRRLELARLCRDATAGHDRWRALAINAALFLLLALASIAFTASAETLDFVWIFFTGYCALLVLTAVSLALIAAPAGFWRAFAATMTSEIVLATVAAAGVVVMGEVTQEGWSSMSAATMSAAYTLLLLFEPNVVVDWDLKKLGANGFVVEILPECSGYEGIGLVIAFLSIFLITFRRSLRFPNALLLLPIGVAAIWLINVARIAGLISLGAHVSPVVALNGFHSQAGWIGFLIVTVSIMVAASRLPVFAKGVGRAAAVTLPGRANERRLLAYLAPFMALMASSIIASAFAPHDQWLYTLKVAAVGTAIWVFRDVYRGLVSQVSVVALAAGALVGVVWAFTDPNQGDLNELGIWLAQQAVPVAAFWLFVRAAGAVVLVPIAEELAFRGYLLRAIASRHFETVSAQQITFVGIVISSVLFGFIHERWLSAALAGAVYAVLMLRTGRVSDAVTAHIASNAVIVLWAVAFSQWSLL